MTTTKMSTFTSMIVMAESSKCNNHHFVDGTLCNSLSLHLLWFKLRLSYYRKRQMPIELNLPESLPQKRHLHEGISLSDTTELTLLALSLI